MDVTPEAALEQIKGMDAPDALAKLAELGLELTPSVAVDAGPAPEGLDLGGEEEEEEDSSTAGLMRKAMKEHGALD